jgi:hypothetical protein
MAVDPWIEYFSRDLVPKYCQGLESCADYTAPPFLVKSPPGRSNSSLPRLLLRMQPEDIIPTLLTSSIHIGWCLPNAITVTRLRILEMIDILLIVRIYKSVGLGGIRNFPLRRVWFLYWLVRGIPVEGVFPYPLQSKVRTPPPSCHWTTFAWQISLNSWLPHYPLHSDVQWMLPPPCPVHQHPDDLHRQTHCVTMNPVPSPVLLALPLLSAVLTTCLPQSLIQKPAQSLQIHCEREL